MSQMEMHDEQRRGLRQFTRSKYVQRDEFCKLLLSCRKMVRADEPEVDVRGILDLETGTRFLIERRKLFRP